MEMPEFGPKCHYLRGLINFPSIFVIFVDFTFFALYIEVLIDFLPKNFLGEKQCDIGEKPSFGGICTINCRRKKCRSNQTRL